MAGGLEDDFSDIIQKARAGLGRSAAEVASRAGLSPSDLKDLESGRRPPKADETRRLAQNLQLDPDKLEAIAAGRWQPRPIPPPGTPPVIRLTGMIGNYPVHGYLCFDPKTRKAVLIDTAYEPRLALVAVAREGLRLEAIVLTHCHRDHIGGLDRLREATGAVVVVHPAERALYDENAERPPDREVGEGDEIPFGESRLRALETPGHTAGGVSYLVDGTVFVGDALFAGSMGRSMSPAGFETLRASLADKILTLPIETRLCPGHGPMTTVGEERQHNPFFIGTSF